MGLDYRGIGAYLSNIVLYLDGNYQQKQFLQPILFLPDSRPQLPE